MSTLHGTFIDALLAAEPRLWRAGRIHHRTPAPVARAVPTGHVALDTALPDGGWPRAALAEVLVAQPGSGELSLLLPALAAATRERAAVLIAPPLTPYAPALAAAGVELARLTMIDAAEARDAAWAAEQALRAGGCGLVVAWLAVRDARLLRRLALAAEAGACTGILVREPEARWTPSPAALRLALAPTLAGVEIEIIKCRGTPGARHLELKHA